MNKTLFLSCLLIFSTSYAKTPALKQLKMPEGFKVEIFAENVPNARHMALGDQGTVFIGSTQAGKVYALVPTKERLAKPQLKIIAKNLNQPQGVAFYQGNLYVAEINRIIRYEQIEKRLDHPPPAKLVTDNFPMTSDQQSLIHAWKTIHIGPDHKLYVAIGAPCNSCLAKDPRIGSLMRMELDGSHMEIYAKGVRNSVGFAWQPKTNKLWFTDNGRDYLGDDIPPDKLNYAPNEGLDFGFPYYHGKDGQGKPIADPQWGKLRSTQGISWEACSLPAHVAALGMVFYTGQMFPSEYHNQIIIAEHGSWNRSKKIGYRLSLVKVKGDRALSYRPFITGWQKNGKFWGRPVAPLVMPDGSLLVSDDYAGVVYRFSYQNSNH